MSDIQYGMVIDTRGCCGCQTCVISCKTSNEVPGEGFWSAVHDLDGGELYVATGSPARMKFRPTLCNHCESPACIKNCPTGAMHKDDATGIVSVDKSVCIGCESCSKACPYGVPVLDEEAGLMGKCDFCADRVAKGEEPYCVASCIGRVRHFGNISDPESEASKLIAETKAEVYMPESGTNPSVYYIV